MRSEPLPRSDYAMSFKEIAQELGITEIHASKICQRALEKMRKALKEKEQ